MSVGETYLTMQGWVGGEIRFKEVAGEVAVASFRLGTTPRWFDKDKGRWIDRPTTWFTVECWRTLAENVYHSVQRGQPVVVTGRLKTTEWTENDEPRSRTVLDAFSVGHDLTRGTARFSKNQPRQQWTDGSAPDEEMRERPDQAEDEAAARALTSEPSPFPAEEVANAGEQQVERQAA